MDRKLIKKAVEIDSKLSSLEDIITEVEYRLDIDDTAFSLTISDKQGSCVLSLGDDSTAFEELLAVLRRYKGYLEEELVEL